MVFATALFAVTLNFIQPLAHAALLHGDLPIALWTAFCTNTAGGGDRSGSAPAQAAEDHECCLGLAHAQTLIAPLAIFLLVGVWRSGTTAPADDGATYRRRHP